MDSVGLGQSFKENKKEKTIETLTDKELVEDLSYYVDYAQKQSPPFVDKTYDIVKKYINELYERVK